MPSSTESIYLDPTALRDAVSRLGLHGYDQLLDRMRPLGARLVTDVYALQQVVYEHHLAGDAVFGYALAERLESLVSAVHPVGEHELLIAGGLSDEYPQLPPRERLQLAVMRAHGIEAAVTGVPARYRHVREIRLLSLRGLLAESSTA